MLQKSSLPAVHAAVAPIPGSVIGHEERRIVPIEPPAVPRTENRESAESYEADRALHAMLARFSGGISPTALLLAYADWLSHLVASPQRQLEIAQEGLIDT